MSLEKKINKGKDSFFSRIRKSIIGRVAAYSLVVGLAFGSLGYACGNNSSSDDESCEEIRQMIGDEINDLNDCSNDDECTMITVLTCHWVAINASANTEKLNELDEEFNEKQCFSVCPMNVPIGVYCEEGKCKLTDY